MRFRSTGEPDQGACAWGQPGDAYNSLSAVLQGGRGARYGHRSRPRGRPGLSLTG